MTQSLQFLLNEQIDQLPRLIADRLVRAKLEPYGLADNETIVDALVAHIFSGTDDSSIQIDVDLPEGTLPDRLLLNIDDEDLAFVTRVRDVFSEELPELLESMTRQAADTMNRRYRAGWPQWRSEVVAETARFRSNIEKSWSKGFDLLRMLIEISREQGMEFDRRAQRSRSTKHTHLNTALSHLHARALQIASEIMVLMESGFADGAMARWRTLHEVTCVAMVLSEGGDALAQRYLDHDAYESKKALGVYQQCHEALGFRPFSKRDATQIQRAYDAAIASYGDNFGSEYGWAAAYLKPTKPKFRPGFDHIEAAAGRAMMRTYYKMASHNVHAGAKGIMSRLSTFEGSPAAIAGASNVGFTEPGQNLGLSLLHFTMLLLPRRWTVDKIAFLMAIIDLESRVGPALVRSQTRIARDERKIRRLLAEPAFEPAPSRTRR